MRAFAWTLVILSGVPLISAGLRNLGTVSLKGSLGIGLRPGGGKGDGIPQISTHYGFVPAYKGGSGKEASRAPKSPGGFVASCCKGSLQFFGQNIFGHGSIKGQFIQGHQSPSYTSSSGSSKPQGVANYYHLNNQQDSTGGVGGKPGSVSGVGVVSNNEIHGGDHPIKFKNYNSYKQRKYPKPVPQKEQDDEGYPPRYNFKKYKTGDRAPVQSYEGGEGGYDVPFWTKGKSPLVIDGGGDNKGHEDNDYHGPPSYSDSHSYPLPKDKPSYHADHDDHHSYHHPSSRYPSPNEPVYHHQHPDSGSGSYHSTPSSYSNSIFDSEHHSNHEPEPTKPTYASLAYQKTRGSDFFPSRSRPSRDYGPSSELSPMQMQVIDHHHPPYNGGPHSTSQDDSGHYDNDIRHSHGHDHDGPINHEETKYPTVPPFYSPPPLSSIQRGRTGFTTPKFRPLPLMDKPLPMIPMTNAASSFWMPSNGPRLKKSATTSSPNPDKDLKYRVYEYGKKEVIVIDGGLQGHEKDLVRAHVYSKDGGKLLRTIEIKDAVDTTTKGLVSQVASNRSDSLVLEENKPEDKPVMVTPSTATTTTTTTATTSAPTTTFLNVVSPPLENPTI